MTTPRFEVLTSQTHFDMLKEKHSSELVGVVDQKRTLDDTCSTYFGYVLSGFCHLTPSSLPRFELIKGMYFSLPGKIEIDSSHGKVVVFRKPNYIGLTTFGGPIEKEGRLLYIDSCKATNLINPAKVGDPCLHLLTFPPNIVQSSHTHPSLRFGVVAGGSGYCLRPNQDKLPLTPGMVFNLPAGCAHSFESLTDGLKVIAYHPDSDVGPTDEIHQMKFATHLI